MAVGDARAAADICYRLPQQADPLDRAVPGRWRRRPYSAHRDAGAYRNCLDSRWFVDNRGGADGAIAGNAVKTAAPDGYTLLFATTTGLNAAPIMRKQPPYDPVTAFTPISMVGKFGFFLFVHESLPAKTVAEFLNYVRANPGKVNYATGNGTSVLATAQLALAEKLDMHHIPYKGDAPATADLIAGRVQVMIGTPGSAMPQVQEGRLRVLCDPAIASESAGAGCADDCRDRFDRADDNAMGRPIRSGETSQGSRRSRRGGDEGDLLRVLMCVDHSTKLLSNCKARLPEEMATVLKDQLEVWRRTVQEVGIEPN